MKKLTATLVTALALVAATGSAAGASTGDTGSYGPAEEPSWVIPLVVLFVLICAVSAFINARSGKRSD